MIRRFLVGSIGMPIVGALVGWPVSAKLRELNRSQWWTEDQLRALQSEKLVRLVDHAYKTVPFYKQVCDEQGLSPADIRSIDDYSKLPIISKDQIRANYPDGVISAAYDRRKLAVRSTSGSTGEPLRFTMNGEEKAYKWASLFRYWDWAGWHPGDRWIVLSGMPIGSLKSKAVGSFLENNFSRMKQLSTYLMDQERAVEYVKAIRDYRPVMVKGYASTLQVLAETAIREKIELNVGCINTSGETLFECQRKTIEKAFGCRIFDGYGGDTAEIAGQCEHGSYHINAENCLIEVVDSAGRSLPAGEMGQVVITDLNAFSMPFIRYNLMDAAELSDEACPCGRRLPLLKRIYGRLADVGITSSGRVIVVYHFLILMSKYVDAIKAFQVTQDAPDEFTLKLVKGGEFEAREAELDCCLHEILGAETKIAYEFVDEIPCVPGGKRRLFISSCGIPTAGSQPDGGRQ